MKLFTIRAPSQMVKLGRQHKPLRALSIAIACTGMAVTAWTLAWPLPALREHAAQGPTTPVANSVSDQKLAEPEIQVADLMGRPLFRRDRRPGLPPPSEPEPAAKQADVEVAANRRAALQRYELSGTVIAPGYKVAILIRAGDPKMLLVREGDDLDGWVVGTIEKRGLSLKSGEDMAELVFPAPKSPQGPPQVTAAVPAR